jgi:hypothetical protein
LITTAQFLEILLLEHDIIETIITSMALRKHLRSPDSKLVADDTRTIIQQLTLSGSMASVIAI